MSVKRIKFGFLMFFILFVQSSLFAEKKSEKATFAGGCFWCMEHPFEKLEGVSEVISGYTGGRKKNPTYEEVSAGATFHFEAIQITYDPSKISYSELLDVFWRQIDPTDPGGQFVDRGLQYRTAIFYHNDEQKRLAVESKEQLDKSGRYDREIVTEITEATPFYKAEDYHQKYYLRKRPEILQELLSAYPEKDSFVASTAAARINGYLGCNGEKDEIEEALPQLGLSAEMQARLVKYVSTNCGRLAGLTCPAPKR